MEFDLSCIEISRKDILKKLVFPQHLTLELAELIGIIIGDGHLSLLIRRNTNGNNFIQSDVFIAGNRDETDYIKYIENLFYRLFNCRLSYREDKRSKAILLTAHSKGIVQFLNKVCGIPTGRKVDSVTIPKIVKDATSEIKCAFLRGLFDTDFCLSFRKGSNYRYPTIRGGFCSENLIRDLELLFKNLGYRYCCCYNLIKYDKRFDPVVMHYIYLNGSKNLEKWILEIGSSNHKFLLKMETWKNTGFCRPAIKNEAPVATLSLTF